jgi:Ca-activated chloride channel family protein
MNEQNDPRVDDFKDRLTDRALAEVLGEDRPPDLSARILTAASTAATPAEPSIQETTMNAPSRKPQFSWTLFAVAATVLIGVGVALLYPTIQAARETARNQPVVNELKNWGGAVDEDGDENRIIIQEEAGERLDISDFTSRYGVKVEAGGQLLPSPAYLTDDVRYNAPGPEFRLADEAGAMRESILTETTAAHDRRASDGTPPATSYLRPTTGGLQPRPGNSVDKFTRVLPNEGKPGDELIPQPLNPVDSDPAKPGDGRGPGQGGDQYSRIIENPFLKVTDHPLSTFSIDVDTASYANVRQFLMQNHTLPPADAVRIEELVNYFAYDYAPPAAATPVRVVTTDGKAYEGEIIEENNNRLVLRPSGEGAVTVTIKKDAIEELRRDAREESAPFAAHIEVTGCPWEPKHRLVRVGLKGQEVERDQRPYSNLVFLCDVSGSMNEPAKLPLLKHGLKLLAEQLEENDRVAIVVYASAEGLVLPSTSGHRREEIIAALDSLNAGGSTNGGAGIRLAYKIAKENFIEGGVNRVILCTDGDFNVGATSNGELEQLATDQAKSGVFLTVMGFGRGNLNDAMMEKISNVGNGNYYYVDSVREAQKVLVDEMGGTLVAIAKDVKIQIEFNPAQAAGYRLIGYENRMLAKEDFNDDKKDAGEIGAGRRVTALYEVVPAGGDVPAAQVDELKYQKSKEPSADAEGDELLTLKLRYKQPDGEVSKLLTFPVRDEGAGFGRASEDTRFAASVASFGMLLRGSQFKGNATFGAVLEIAQSSLGDDPGDYRAEFVEIVKRAKVVSPELPPAIAHPVVAPK